MKLLAYSLLLLAILNSIDTVEGRTRRQSGSRYPGSSCCTSSSAQTIRSHEAASTSSRTLSSSTDLQSCTADCDKDPVCEGFSFEEKTSGNECILQSDFGEVETSNVNVDTHFKAYIALQNVAYTTIDSIDSVVNTSRSRMEELCHGEYTDSCLGFVLKQAADGIVNGSVITEIDAKSKSSFGNESGVTTYLREGNFSVMRVLGEYESYKVSVTKLKLHTMPRDASSSLCTCAAINNRFNFFCQPHLKDETLVEISCGLPAPTDSTGTCTAPKCVRTPLFTNFFCKGDEKTWSAGTHEVTCDRGDNLTVTVWERSSAADASSQLVLDPMSVATLPSGAALRHMADVGSSSGLLGTLLRLIDNLLGVQPLCLQDSVADAETAPASAVEGGSSASLSLWRKTGTAGLQKVANLTGSADDQKVVDELANERLLTGAIQTAGQAQHLAGGLFVRLPGVKLPALLSSSSTESDLAACEAECEDADCDAFSAHKGLLSGTSNPCLVLNTLSLGALLTLSADSDYVTFVRMDSGLLGRLVSATLGSLVGELCSPLPTISATNTVYEVSLGLSGSELDTQ